MNERNKRDKFLYTLILISSALFLFHLAALWPSKENPYYLFDGDVIYLLTGLKLFHQQPIPLLWSPALPQVIMTGILNLLPSAVLSLLNMDYQKLIYLHLKELMFWSRCVTLLLTYLVPLLSAGIVLRNTQSLSSSLFMFVGMLSMRFFPDAWSGYQFDAETFSMFFFVIWMALIFKFKRDQSDSNRRWIFLLCGILTAQKFCNIVVLPFTFLFLFSISQQKLDSSIVKKGLSGIGWFMISLVAFFIPVLPQINNRLPYWLQMAFHKGQYATGEVSFFAFDKTLTFLKYLAGADPFVLGVAGPMAFLLWRALRGNFWIRLNILLLIVSTLVYAKLSVFRYLTIPLAAIWFLAAYLLASATAPLKKVALVFCTLLLVLMPLKELKLQKDLRVMIENSAAIEKFISGNPPKGVRLWTHGAAEEYAIPWANGHALDFFPNSFFEREYRYGILLDFNSLEYKPVPPIQDQQRLAFPKDCWGQILVPKENAGEVQSKLGEGVAPYLIPNSTTVVFIRETDCESSSL